MTNRQLSRIIKDQNPLTLTASATVQRACAEMWKRKVGAVMVTDKEHRLLGIFTGRDAVRVLAEGRNPITETLAETMTPNPDTISPESTAIEALRAMSDGGYRHVPIVKDGKIFGIVSRGDFQGLELDRLEDEINLTERIG